MSPSRSGSWPSSISWGDDVNLEKIKMLLGISAENTSEDAALCFILDDVRETILNYCNIEELPSGLENTACRMALDLYRYDRPGSTEGLMSVATVTEGKTSTSFTRAADALQGGVLADYKAQLNRYRKLRWNP